MEPKYPHVCVQLTGEDGNVFAIIGRVRRALRDAGEPEDVLDVFSSEVMDSESYDAALQTVMRWVSTK